MIEMGLLTTEGWDHIAGAITQKTGWLVSGSSTTALTITTGRITGQSLLFQNTGSGTRDRLVQYFLPSGGNKQSGVFGFALKHNTAPGASATFFRAITTAGAVVFYFAINPLTLYPEIRDSSLNLLATGSRQFIVNGWHYYEIKFFVNGASGTIEVHQDGAVIIPSTTVNIGTNNVGGVQFYTSSSFGNFGALFIDDFYWLDLVGAAPLNNFLGDVRVETIFPTAEGASSDFVPLSGVNNALMVDDPGTTGHDSDATYVSSNVVNAKDTYVMSDVAAVVGTIFAAKINVIGRKDDAVTRQFKTVIRHGGTDYDGPATHTLTASYINYDEIYSLNPATGLPWTINDINNDEFGLKIVT